MKKLNIALNTIIFVLFFIVIAYAPQDDAVAESEANPAEDTVQSIYDFTALSIDGKEISFDLFRGKILLIVNTASNCGYNDQFIGLQKIYDKYKDNNLLILGFPCNQFGSQEPGTNEEILDFCQTNFNVTFPMFAKIDVNGRDTHPLFKYLKKSAPGMFGSQSIKWNFTKFLVDQNGKVLKRYPSQIEPEKIAFEIEELINIDERLTDLR